MSARKPAALRQNTITKDIRADGLAMPAPPPPPGLLKATREHWARFWVSEVARLVTPADLPALEELHALMDEQARWLRVVRGQRVVPGGGATGKLAAPNPAAGHVSALAGKIARLRDGFGLTPQSRLRLGVQFGEARRSLADLSPEVADGGEPTDPRAGLA